jgi:hypothetical protein
MTQVTFKFRKGISVGDVDAEYDEFLVNAFLDTGDLEIISWRCGRSRRSGTARWCPVLCGSTGLTTLWVGFGIRFGMKVTSGWDVVVTCRGVIRGARVVSPLATVEGVIVARYASPLDVNCRVFVDGPSRGARCNDRGSRDGLVRDRGSGDSHDQDRHH